MRTLRTKLTLLVALITVMMTVLVGVIVAGLMTSSIRAAEQERSVAQASALAQLYSQQAEDVAKGEQPTPISDGILAQLASDANVWYIGVSFYARGEKVLSAPEDLKLDPARIEAPVRVEWSENGQRLTGGAAPVQLRGETIGVIVVAFNQQGMPLIRPLFASLVLAILLALLIGVIAAGWFASKITRPLAELTQAAQAVSLGKRATMPDYDRQDEVKELHDSFQRMFDDLELARERDDHFFASVSHELRTPLGIIIGQLSMVRDGISSMEERLPEIERQTLKMERLIGDLVDIARLRQGRFELVNEHLKLNEWGPYVSTSWDELLRSREIGLTTEWGPEDQPELLVDPERLEQVMVNLVRNAGRYARSCVKVSVSAREDGVEVYVQDDGPDIDLPNDSRGEEIFGSFVSDGMPGGLGMGLTISRELARAMGGDLVWVSPDRRQPNALDGATFCLSLPAAGE
jgi:signal transduction histidine kinase